MVARLPLPLVSYFAPIPPAPFPSGEGGDFRLFYARGSAPCIPATEPVRHWGMGANHAPGGGRAPARHLFALPPCCLVGGRGGFGRPPAPAFTFFFAPIPPPPFPAGRGRPRLFHARGFAPCIPATEPVRHWGMGANHAPGGGRAPARHLFALPPCCLVGERGGFGRPPAPAFSFLFRPHPPSPLPLRGRGRL